MALMNQIKTVCVYCGSGPGTNPRFVEAAEHLGKIFAENNIRLVYGGGSVGLMGAIAKSTLEHGGAVTGIIPDFLRARENALTKVQEMIVTPDMHERKRLMFERSDAFVALPGGVGTLEELVEMMTGSSSAATPSRSCSPMSTASGSRCCRCSPTCGKRNSSGPISRLTC